MRASAGDEHVSGAETNQGLQLVKYFCEHGRTGAALDVLESILYPKPIDTEEQRRQERRFERYSTIETLDDTFDQFVGEAGEDFVRILEDTLRATRQSEEDETGTVHYESVANRKPIKDLNYDKTNTGERKHILYTYLSRAATHWVNKDANDTARKQLIHNYLDEEDPNFRRLGLFLLSDHPKIDIARTRSELLEEENYHQEEIQFEFYRLLDQGFQHLSPEDQKQVCQLIRNGPPDNEEVAQRAEYFAEKDDDSVDEVKQRIIEKWHRNRLYLIIDDLPQEHLEYLNNVLDRYGSPERLSTEPFSPDSYGGRVAQKEPDELGEILVTRQKRFSNSWPSGNHPNDNRTFPWRPVFDLCEYIENHPEGWSDRCRFDIATLIRNAIVSDVTDFPAGNGDRTKQLLLNLATEIEVDPDAQPRSWIGGTSQEEARDQAINALVMLAVWQHSNEGESELDPEIKEAIRSKIASDTDLEVRTALGRQFGNLWALDEELIKDSLDDLFPTGDSLDAKQLFSRAFNGYLSQRGCHGPAYDLIRPYYFHTIGLTTEKEFDQEFVNEDALAGLYGGVVYLPR